MLLFGPEVGDGVADADIVAEPAFEELGEDDAFLWGLTVDAAEEAHDVGAVTGVTVESESLWVVVDGAVGFFHEVAEDDFFV